MIETLTTAVIVLAICLVGLALMFGVLLSDQNKHITRVEKDVFETEEARRSDYYKLCDIEKRIDRTGQDTDLKGVDRAINGLADKVERHENTFKTLSSAQRVARWRDFNKFNIMREGERQVCEYCLSDDTEYDTEYIDIAGSTAPDRLVRQCCKCGQKSTLWRFDSE